MHFSKMSTVFKHFRIKITDTDIEICNLNEVSSFAIKFCRMQVVMFLYYYTSLLLTDYILIITYWS